VFLATLLLGGCADPSGLATTEQNDSTVAMDYPDAELFDGALLSAFYGLDDAIPFLASYRICGEFGHQDGMPVIFPQQIDLDTLEAGDFLVTLEGGAQLNVACATPAPAEDAGELRTILLIGDFGSMSNQPARVEVTGNIISLDQKTNFKGADVQVTRLEDGPTLIYAEAVPEDQWDLGKEATTVRFGGGSGCPADTRQVVRVVWRGGVTKPGGDEVDDLERAAYQVFVLAEDGELTEMVPFAIGDLGDGDNNHELCLDVEARAVRVAFPEGLLTDPRDDLNPATEVSVSYGPES
jgi:hypothetical protein